MSYKTQYLRPLFDGYNQPHPIHWNSVFKKDASLVVEIGFGLGEVLFKRAKENPGISFIGIEEIWERIDKALQTIGRYNDEPLNQSIENIRILKVDARQAFQYFFAVKSIDSMYALFPCPWPKKGHVKHRLFSHDFLKLLNSRLKIGGDIQIVTDHKPYFNWILEEMKDTGFDLSTDMVKPQFNTKFERKWQAEGQHEFFEIRMVKTFHHDIICQGEFEMKSFIVKDFQPEKFHLENKTGEISVIFKDFIYDPSKQTAVVMVLVAEEDMNQYLRVVISKTDIGWRVMRADGQNFFPTSGIAQAIQLVYEAARQTNQV